MFSFLSSPQQLQRSRHRISIRRACAHDEVGLALFYAGLGRLTLRRRFHCAIQALSSGRIQQLSRLSYEEPSQVQTFVARRLGVEKPLVVGHAGWRVDGSGSAEFALVVADAFQGQGLGRRLLNELVTSARHQGLLRLHASVLRDNDAMLGLLQQAGVRVAPDRQEPGVLRAEIQPLSYRPPQRHGLVHAMAAALAQRVMSACRFLWGNAAAGSAS